METAALDVLVYTDARGRQPFAEWLNGISDVKVRATLKARIARLETGNLGDCSPVGGGIQELRAHLSPGYRVYFAMSGEATVVLLGGVEGRWHQAHPAAGHSGRQAVLGGRQGDTMTSMNRSRRHRPWRAVVQESIRDPKEAAAYLNAAAEQGDSRAFLIALKDVIDVHGGVTKLAGKTRLNRGNLYRMLSGRGFPRLDTLSRVLRASGLAISIAPLAPSRGKSKRASGGV
jgi:putative addiction module killer protein/probable addiction module antidote protein